MNINPSSIARDRTASRRELPNNLRRAPRKTNGFYTPNVGPLRTMHNVNRTGATISMVTARRPLVQNSKIPERQTISLGESPITGAKLTLPPTCDLLTTNRRMMIQVAPPRGNQRGRHSPLKDREKLVGRAERQHDQRRRVRVAERPVALQVLRVP